MTALSHDLYKILAKTDNHDGTHRLKLERPAVGSETPVIVDIDVADDIAAKAIVGADLYAKFNDSEEAKDA